MSFWTRPFSVTYWIRGLYGRIVWPEYPAGYSLFLKFPTTLILSSSMMKTFSSYSRSTLRSRMALLLETPVNIGIINRINDILERCIFRYGMIIAGNKIRQGHAVGLEIFQVRKPYNPLQLILFGNEDTIHAGVIHDLQRLDNGPVRRNAAGIFQHNVFDLDKFRIRPKPVFADKGFYIMIMGLFQNIFRCITLYDEAVLNNTDPIRHFDCFIHIMGDKDDRFFELLLELDDGILQVTACYRIQGAEGFIHEDNIGIRGKGPGDADTLLLPADAGMPYKKQLSKMQAAVFPDPKAGAREKRDYIVEMR